MSNLVPESEQQYGSILTVLGENAEQNGKLLNKQIEFTHIAFGDANDSYVQPDRKAQSLVNELYRIPVNSVDVLQPTPDSVPILKVEAILPDDINDVVIREFAAVATFNGQTYFHAIGNCARVYVPRPINNGNVSNPVTLEMTFVITSAEPIVEMDPNVITASRDWTLNETKSAVEHSTGISTTKDDLKVGTIIPAGVNGAKYKGFVVVFNTSTSERKVQSIDGFTIGFHDGSSVKFRIKYNNYQDIYIRDLMRICTTADEAFKLAFDIVEQIELTTAFRGGSSTIRFPNVTIRKPIVFTKQGVKVVGESDTSVLTVSSDFKADEGKENLGKWVCIMDSAYIGEDVYNCFFGDCIIDYQFNDVNGVLVNGGRNKSTTDNIQHLNFKKTLVRLGKSSRDVHSVTQGVRPTGHVAILDGNSGDIPPSISAVLFEMHAANESTFSRCDVVGIRRHDIKITPFAIGTGDYNCGGNTIDDSLASNIADMEIEVDDASGFSVGDVLDTDGAYKIEVQKIDGNTIKGITANNSAYLPLAGDTISNGSFTAVVIKDGEYSPIVFLGNSWGTHVNPFKAVESSTCFVKIEAPSKTHGINNRVHESRKFSNTCSCYADVGLSSYTKINMPTYVDSAQIKAAAEVCIVEQLTNQNLPLVRNMSDSSYVLQYSRNGLNILPKDGAQAKIGFNNGGILSSEYAVELITSSAIKLRDKNYKVRVEVTYDGHVYLHDGAGNRKFGVLSSGAVMAWDLPSSGAPHQMIRDENGFLKIL